MVAFLLVPYHSTKGNSPTLDSGLRQLPDMTFEAEPEGQII